MSDLTPKQIVAELDHHIIGQTEAKRAVAIALRNQWRRARLDEDLRGEVIPKNILMIGPTGVGKTEIARRLAKLANAPFIKIEATKFTEVGYVGRDVESIIRDLADYAVKMQHETAVREIRPHAQQLAEDRVLDILLPQARDVDETEDESTEESSTRQKFRQKIKAGEMDDREIELEVQVSPGGVEIMGPPGMEDMTSQLQGMFQNMMGNKKRTRTLKIKEALKVLTDEEAHKLIDEDDLKAQSLESVEQHGIVFLDEIDKVAKRADAGGGGDVSREGVQRDLLPLVEGSTVSTKHGMVKTDHILFIASGAFHVTKPSDLIPELQGRFPIRVELDALSSNDFMRILTEPDASLTRQAIALMGTEGLTLSFTEDGIKKIADMAFLVNEQNENIGARRLHTVLERLLEDVSFDASERSGDNVVVDAAYVAEKLADLTEDQDLTQYIL